MDIRLISIAIVPLMYYISYLLVIVSEGFRQKNYAKHITYDNYIYPTIVNEYATKKQWFNLPMLIGSLFPGLLLFLVVYFNQPMSVFDLICGMLITQAAVTIGVSLSHISYFKYAADHPESLSGKAHFSNAFIIQQTLSHVLYIGGMIILMVLTYQPSMFAIGCLTGIILLAFRFWRFRVKEVTISTPQVSKQQDFEDTPS